MFEQPEPSTWIFRDRNELVFHNGTAVIKPAEMDVDQDLLNRLELRILKAVLQEALQNVTDALNYAEARNH